MKTVIRFLISALTLATIAGCFPATRALLKDNQYDEYVSSVLMSQDKKKLVIITPNYHYVFDMPDKLPGILESSSFRERITANVDAFKVFSSGKVVGGFGLNYFAKNETEISEATKHGMREICCFKPALFYHHDSLNGERFNSGGIEPTLSGQKLNKTYRVRVWAEQAEGEKASKLLLSPITLLVDGTLAIGTMPLLLSPAGPFVLMQGN